MGDHDKYFAVFGNPVIHSLSPPLYNRMFMHCGYRGYYTRILAGSGVEVAGIIRKYELSGANITTPFKEMLVPCLDELSEEAAMLGAVNTVLNRGGGHLTGYNTDGCGLTGSLKETGILPANRKCIVFGTGGAGKAAALALVRSGADVVITGRSYGKAENFAGLSGCRSLPMNKAVMQLSEFEIIVLALPPGIYPFDPDHLSREMIIVDANYRSPHLAAGEDDFPCRLIRGDRWLLHQAVEAYRLFTGLEADAGIMEQGLYQKPATAGLGIESLGDDFRELITKKKVDMFVGNSIKNDH